MKAIKYILSIVLLIAIVWSCKKVEDNFDFVSTATAPANITVLFGITQDNTGLVTITPNGEGAISYDIIFGDNTADPANIKQGQSVVHTYTEGTFQVKIAGNGVTGLKTEITQDLVVSFKAPENLEVVIENDQAVSKKVNVTANADYAILFDVYFGEVVDETPVSANIGATASYVYQEAGTYTIRVVAKGGAIQTAQYTEEFVVTAILQPTASAPTPPSRSAADVISIYSAVYTDIDSTNYNPDWGQSGQGSGFAEFDLNGDKMLQYINLSYQGIGIGETIDVSAMEFLHMDVWTAAVDSIETSLINGVDGNSTEKPVWTVLTADAWTRIDIPISAYTDQGLSVDQIFQLKLVGAPWAGGTVFVDNIYFYKAASAGQIVFDDFEGNGNITTWFGDACGMDNAFANPYKEGINTSNTVLEYNDTGGQYANIRFDLPAGETFDLMAKRSFSLKIYVASADVAGSQPNQISLKLQDGTVGEPWASQTEIIKTISLDTWQVVTFDFSSDVTAGAADPLNRTDFNRVVLQVNSENNTDPVKAYIDDFNYEL